MRSRFLFILLTSAFLFTGTLTSSAADYSGTWVANLEKSQLGTAQLKSYVMKVEKTAPNSFLVTFDTVRSDGQKTHQQFMRIYDGQEHAIYADGKEHPGIPRDATETCSQVDPLTRHVVAKNGGKVIFELDAKMEPDEKTMITRRTSFAPDGQKREAQVIVWERR
jgi:hypothetical protein